MKISYNWLNEYIQTGKSPAELSALLTGTGLEVESLEKVQSIPGGLEGLVVGEVISKSPHPNADRLNLTLVDVGAEAPLRIVCGAANVAEGQKVVVAVEGTTVYPLSGQPFEIRKAKIRGEASSGMICAEDEIGLGRSHDGIMVLPADAVPGTPLKEYFKLRDDWVMEIGLTPNRADAASHIGTARDVAAVLKKKITYPSLEDFREGTGLQPVKVRVADEEACIRYSGLVIQNITLGESPRWLQDRLKAIGVKCINNVVDITNYVLHETGQPLHAFDLEAIRGGAVVVKTLPEGSTFLTLDGVERKLSAEDLMICDADGGMCIAGVFGGADSGIREDTTGIFLESACFNPVSVRRTAKRHGLKTDASFRFERGTDPNATLFALKRAAMLICEIAGGEIPSELIDLYPREVKKAEVHFSFENARRLIGKEIPRQEILAILEHLEIAILKEDANTLTLAIPTAKVDVTREIDVIEEILRIYGYDNVEMPAKVNASLSYSQKPDEASLRHSIADLLSGKGFFEIMCNSLGSSSHTRLIPALEEEEAVKILNPLSSELDQMRQTLLFSGLQSVAYNLNRKNTDLKFYEFGKVYRKMGAGYEEKRKLSLYVTGRKFPETWNSDKSKADIFYLKGFVEAVLQKLGIQPGEFKPLENDFLEEAFEYSSGGERLLRSGSVPAGINAAFEIEAPVFYAEFEWDQLLRLRREHKVTYREVPRFPAVRRDLSLLITNEASFGYLEQIARKTENRILKEVSIFDKYISGEGQKGQLPPGTKSYALSFVLRDDEQTLTEKQIDQVMQRLIRAFEKEGVEIRK
ncbi:phenylalanyl-tRNA synthetase beta subunit [Anseongella ginsenosidimutans]|uniref:Phenylalanine--tRNA ligase beta subunit n=1 Tax=Anseongella ginsenosidimutans TaxID=496056 RepID=A0A4R3KQ55_9SPHI|nr:phenylalanine--tRNA ligase subunit beta [Anseongella ginsenosidimutans]QEC52313.1 phenylalanine--tRNA ligase subunit beta [Anseongella ginsenosidimutans]TCS86876.1 phenylalanyl-tRNA synthetase beta subunit [Anseongella ginsenosidimutans]